MSLTDEVQRLKLISLRGVCLALFWQSQIAKHGEYKIEVFRQSKSVEWEGLNLCRDPTEIEKLCIKSIATAQDAGKASVSKILLGLRTDLIDQGVIAIKKLASADYHTLTLEAPSDIRAELRNDLGSIFMVGKKLVSAELDKQRRKAESKQSEATETDDQELDDLTDLTDSRVLNDVQSRIAAAAARFALLGLTGAALWQAVRDEVESGSVGYIDRAAQGVANRVLNFGRAREMEDRSGEIGLYEYSAILDQNTCGPCAADDGEQSNREDDLTDVPNPDCEGGDWCRCFHVAIAEGNM